MAKKYTPEHQQRKVNIGALGTMRDAGAGAVPFFFSGDRRIRSGAAVAGGHNERTGRVGRISPSRRRPFFFAVDHWVRGGAAAAGGHNERTARVGRLSPSRDTRRPVGSRWFPVPRLYSV